MATPAAPLNERLTKFTGPTALRRGGKALKPEVLTTEEPMERADATKEDPQHPLRGGGERRRAWAERPGRKKGTLEWLERQIDSYQRRTLMIAFRKYENKAKRLELCKRRRAGLPQHAQLPLKPPADEEKACTDAACHCHPHYRMLVGMDGGIGTGEPAFVRNLFATWRAEARKAPRAAVAQGA